MNLSLDYYKIITEKESDIIYIVTPDARIKFLNKSIESIFETTVEEIEKNNFDYLMLPKDKVLANKLKEERLQGKSSVFEHGFITPNGKLVYLECSATPIFNDENEIIASLGIARDITLKKKTEEELKNANIELENLVKTKDKLLSVIAHDLRNPFNIIIGYSDLILRNIDKLNKEDIKKYVKAINNSSNNTFDLLKNLLEWSRTKSNKIVVSPEKLNLNKVIDLTIESLKYTAQYKNINIQYENNNDHFVFVDENMLKTVLRNLISNAIKFSFRKNNIIINLVEEESQFIVQVIDYGIGISEENIKNLFKEEHSFTQQGTDKERGTGFGLSICKEFVTKWNGSIWVESKLEEGSIFSFSIPK